MRSRVRRFSTYGTLAQTFAFCLVFVIAMLPAMSAQASAEYQFAMESFEGGIPSDMEVVGGKIVLDQKRIKEGLNALRWEWNGNGKLILNRPIGYQPQQPIRKSVEQPSIEIGKPENPVLERPRGFFVWLYNETPTSQRLRFQFGRPDQVDCEFDVNLNFSGWRTVWVIYDRGDMRGIPREDMTQMTILAPSIGSGTIYLDAVGLSVPMNPRNSAPNPQLPNVDPHPRLVTQYAQRLYEWSKVRPTSPVKPLTDEMRESLKRMDLRADEYLLPPFRRQAVSEIPLAKVQADFDSFEIRREGDKIYGRPLVKFHVYTEYFGRDRGSFSEPPVIKTWRFHYCPLLLLIAEKYRSTTTSHEKAVLEDMFIDLFDYGVDQGLADGAGLGWLHHYSYTIRDYGPALYLMRESLKARGRLNDAIRVLRWFTGFGQVYDESVVYGVEGRKSADADDINGLLISRLLTALMMVDSPEKVRDLEYFTNFFSNVTTAYANGLDESFKPDGTTFHHGGHAIGYGGRAINGAVIVQYLLASSPFQASPETYRRLRKAVTTFIHLKIGTDNEIPKTFVFVRFHRLALPEHFYLWPALLALSRQGEPDNMVDLYRKLLASRERRPTDLQAFWADKLEDVAAGKPFSYSSVSILPYSSAAVFRQDRDWMVSLRGHSKYVYPFESWGENYFAFPLYIGNGFLEVSYAEDIDSSAGEDDLWHLGYDWRRWPGSTTVRLPYSAIRTRPGETRDEGGEYLFSDQAFVGGVATEQGLGVFTFPFRGHDKFGLEGFSGNKSYFFINDLVVCLGTDILSNLSEFNVETTLFQNAATTDVNQSIVGDGDTYHPLESGSRDLSVPSWFIDNRGTGYLVLGADDDATLRLFKGNQRAPNGKNSAIVDGDFETLLIDHGKSPDKGAYQYIVVPDASVERMQRMSNVSDGQEPLVTVVRDDSKAHVIDVPRERARLFAVYADDGLTFSSGVVKQVSGSSTLIAREDERTLSINLSNPDLAIYEGQDDLLPDGSRFEPALYEREWFYWPSQETRVRVTLRGGWRAADTVVEQTSTQSERPSKQRVWREGKDTVIEFVVRDGLAAQMTLEPLH